MTEKNSIFYKSYYSDKDNGTQFKNKLLTEYYMVYEILDDTFVTIVDGNLRKMSKPQKKKLKHLKNYGDVLENIAEKLKEGKKVYDAEIFSALRKYNS